MENNKNIMEELERACAAACRRFPGDWKKAGKPAPADLVGAAWIELQERGNGDIYAAAKSALFAEAWSFSGHSVGGSVEDLTGLEDYDGSSAADMAEAAAVAGSDAMRRGPEEAAIAAATLEELAADETDRAILAAIAAGLNQQETAAALKIARATVNRRLQAMKARAQR